MVHLVVRPRAGNSKCHKTPARTNMGFSRAPTTFFRRLPPGGPQETKPVVRRGADAVNRSPNFFPPT